MKIVLNWYGIICELDLTSKYLLEKIYNFLKTFFKSNSVLIKNS